MKAQTLLPARSTGSIDTSQSWAAPKTAESLGLAGCWLIAGAAVLQFRGTDVGGFMVSWEQAALKVWALLKSS